MKKKRCTGVEFRVKGRELDETTCGVSRTDEEADIHMHTHHPHACVSERIDHILERITPPHPCFYVPISVPVEHSRIGMSCDLSF